MVGVLDRQYQRQLRPDLPAAAGARHCANRTVATFTALQEGVMASNDARLT